MKIVPGTRLGRYEIIAPLDEDGVEVYRARDRELGRDVAVKVVAAAIPADSEFGNGSISNGNDSAAQARFWLEARAVAALSHPNVLTVHDFGRSGEVAYAVTELLEGVSLADRLRDGPLTWEESVDIAMAVARGLGVAHEKEIFHRDINPGNIFITKSGTVKIRNFGMARVESHDAEPVDTPAEAKATLDYLAPEQIAGGDVGAAADIFSLGCVLREMLTGNRSLASAAPDAVLAAPPSQPQNPISRTDTEMPSSLADIVATCLNPAPKDRFRSAIDVAVALSRLRAQETASFMAVTAHRAVARERWARQAMIFAAVIVVFVCGLIGNRLMNVGDSQRFQSLAVLPLSATSVSEEKGDMIEELHADAMTDALITKLGSLGSLRVIAKTSVVDYRNSNKAVREIAGELAVDAVLMGSITLRSDQVEVRLQVLDAATGEVVWERSFARQVAQIMGLQQEMVALVAASMGITLDEMDPRHLGALRQVMPAAYETYLKGRSYLDSKTESDLEMAAEQFNRAIFFDEEFALAHAGLGDCRATLAGMRPSVKDYPLARIAASEALKLDPGLAEAHTTIGIVNSQYQWKWSAAEGNFRQALEINSGDSRTLRQYALLLAVLGRFEGAMTHAQQAVEHDPRNPAALTNLASIYYLAGRSDRAYKQVNRALDIDPEFGPALDYLSLILVQQGRYEEAIEHSKTVREKLGIDPMSSAEHGYILARAGQRAQALLILDRLDQSAAHSAPPNQAMAYIHIGLGEYEEGIDYLERARESQEIWIRFIKVDPCLEPVSKHERFSVIVRKMGLVPEVF